MSDFLNSPTPPRSPGKIVMDLLRENNMSQSDLASQLGVSKQYISAVVHDRENLSEEKFRKITSTSAKSRELMEEARNFYNWIKTPGGRNFQLKLRQPELLESFSIRGPRILTPKEIKEACNVKLFSITRVDTNDGPETEDPVIGIISPYSITCHLGKMISQDLSNEIKADILEIPPQSSVTVQTQERFFLGKMAALQFNGVVIHLRENGIRCCCDNYVHFVQPEALFLTLDNLTKKKFILQAGMPLITANVYFNPFVDDHQDGHPESSDKVTSTADRM